MVDAPQTGPISDALQGLLALATPIAECMKRVSFPAFTWEAPEFVAEDARVRLRFPFARLTAPGVDALRAVLDANAGRLAGERALLALDARASGMPEFELTHALYGSVTLFAHRVRPFESADPRVHAAQEAGWSPTLKEHNLLPGRGLVVKDEDQGLYLRDEKMRDVLGVHVLLASGETKLLWNPFARLADAELQYYLAWGDGSRGASEWREQFHVVDDG